MFYFAELGRFMARDVKPKGNRYLYCKDDPVNRFDANGLDDDDLIKAIKAASQAATDAFSKVAQEDKDLLKKGKELSPEEWAEKMKGPLKKLIDDLSAACKNKPKDDKLKIFCCIINTLKDRKTAIGL